MAEEEIIRRRRWPRAVGAIVMALAVVSAAALLVGCFCCPRYEVSHERLEPREKPMALEMPVPPAEVHPRLVMRNVHLRLADTFFLDVRSLLSEMVATVEGEAPIFEDPESYTIRIHEGEIAMSAASLTSVLNNFTFAYEGAPLRQLLVETTPEGRLRQRGILHKLIDIPFEIVAELSVTEAGEIRLEPVEMRICDLPGEPLMRIFGMKMEDLLDLTDAAGVRVEGNDLILMPESLLPPPAIEGRVTGVWVEGDQVVQRFASRPGTAPVEHPPPPPDTGVPNYLHFYGGTIRVGRLFMVRTNLQIADADPSDPFELYLAFLGNQLVAGYSRNHPDDSLTTYMPDFHRVGKTLDLEDRIQAGR